MGVYWGLLVAMFVWPAARIWPCWILACGLSFINAIVIHNHLHKGIFKSKSANKLFRLLLSFGNLYPASANLASHNIVHHHFDDDGSDDWASPEHAPFRFNLFNLIHFPNVIGPLTFFGVGAWAKTTRQKEFARQYILEQVFAFGLTALLMMIDFWNALFFIVLPQLWGARGILRINYLQHAGCDRTSDWNHSRNFVGKGLNWIMCNNGFHTIHHNRAGLHWATLEEAHLSEAVPKMDARLNEPSMVLYLIKNFLLRFEAPHYGQLNTNVSFESGLLPLHERRAASELETGL